MERNSSTPPGALFARVFRGAHVESWHRGSLVVVQDDKVVRSYGDPDLPIWCRSAVKPFQALPLLERGVAERLGFGDREIALLSASHEGSERHVAIVRAMLERGGLDAEQLLCGPHVPFDKGAAVELARRGERPGRVHNNCSGKHTGFLLLARDLGVDPAHYLDPESAGQMLVRETLAAMAGVDPVTLDVAVDGCGAPTFRMPLLALARAFARLGTPKDLPLPRAVACKRLLDAISAEPFYLAGQGRICLALIESARGRVYPKNGAEGVYALALPGTGIGVALKVDDGNERGYLPVVVEVLLRLGLWPEVPQRLEEFRRIPVRNTQKRIVGHVVSALSW